MTTSNHGIQGFVDYIAQEALKEQSPALDKILKSLNSIEATLKEIHPSNKLRLISQIEVQELTGFKRDWVDRNIKNGNFPPPMYVGSEKRWYLKDVEQWLENLPKSQIKHG